MRNQKETLWDGTEMKILTPLTGDFFPEEEPEGSMEPLDGRELLPYMESIQEAVDRENSRAGESSVPCNLMEYFQGNVSVKEKVESAVISVEQAEGILYGCAALRLKEPLEAGELQELCEYLTGQYSDGWGEGFEQRDIRVDGGTLNVHFWQAGEMKFQIREAEKNQRALKNDQPPRPEEKSRPKLQLIGHEGNIFSILADAGWLLSRNGQKQEADEMYERVFQSGSYYEALEIISEYVETEVSSAVEKKHQRKQKPGKTPCR
ncbi:MAG: hypothetical protein K1W40_03715 [Schaedlerella sp.]|uniref:hypothetical protein n=1 Tax=Schaedlerella sp. TaxID=2676057 RepID=UPI00265FED9B|nr:hypothetical protein [uncultured Schaedlerella sp.]